MRTIRDGTSEGTGGGSTVRDWRAVWSPRSNSETVYPTPTAGKLLAWRVSIRWKLCGFGLMVWLALSWRVPQLFKYTLHRSACKSNGEISQKFTPSTGRGTPYNRTRTVTGYHTTRQVGRWRVCHLWGSYYPEVGVARTTRTATISIGGTYFGGPTPQRWGSAPTTRTDPTTPATGTTRTDPTTRPLQPAQPLQSA